MLMKGQYKIIFEVLLILAGIIMTSFIITNFQNMQEQSTKIALKDSFNSVANDVLIAVIKASQTNNSIIRVGIPDTIATHTYRILMDGDTLLIASLKDRTINVTRQIFNIGQPNRISRSEVISSGGNIEVVAENGNLRIRRGLVPDTG